MSKYIFLLILLVSCSSDNTPPGESCHYAMLGNQYMRCSSMEQTANSIDLLDCNSLGMHYDRIAAATNVVKRCE